MAGVICLRRGRSTGAAADLPPAPDGGVKPVSQDSSARVSPCSDDTSYPGCSHGGGRRGPGPGHPGAGEHPASAQPGMLQGKSRCPGVEMSLPSLPPPAAPSPGWGPTMLSCLSFPPPSCSGSRPASGPPRPRAGEQLAVPAALLGSVPGGTQAALVCSLASVAALPSPPAGLGREGLPPRPTNRSERLPAPRGEETALPGARGGQTPKPTLPRTPPPSRRSHGSPRSPACRHPAVGQARWVGAAGAEMSPGCPQDVPEVSPCRL